MINLQRLVLFFESVKNPVVGAIYRLVLCTILEYVWDLLGSTGNVCLFVVHFRKNGNTENFSDLIF